MGWGGGAFYSQCTFLVITFGKPNDTQSGVHSRTWVLIGRRMLSRIIMAMVKLQREFVIFLVCT